MSKAGQGESDLENLEMTVFVHDELGLHARPAARITQAAQQFQSEVILIQGQMSADAKSILDILSLAAPRGSSLTLQCRGKDAAEAMSAVSAFFQHVSPENA